MSGICWAGQNSGGLTVTLIHEAHLGFLTAWWFWGGWTSYLASVLLLNKCSGRSGRKFKASEDLGSEDPESLLPHSIGKVGPAQIQGEKN